jgi:HSP90 family molecular chaperone
VSASFRADTVQHLTEFEGKRLINASREGLKLEEGDVEKKREEKYKEMFKPLLDFAKDTLGKKVEKVSISKHLVQSPVVVLSADYGWTAQMEKVMKSQAFADQSKFEFMKSKRMFEVRSRGEARTCAAHACCPAMAARHRPRHLRPVASTVSASLPCSRATD